MVRKMDTFTPEEVSKHNNAGDLWIVLHGKVYDVSTFVKEHPGGEDLLIDLAGKDGTMYFDDIGHSQEAIKLKDGYQIGVLEGELTPTEVLKPTAENDDWEYNEEPSNANSSVLQMLLVLASIIYGVLFYYIYL